MLGPGTGLGAGALIHAKGSWVPVPGEGGHVRSGRDEPDFPLWAHFELEHGRISARGDPLRSRAGAALSRRRAKTGLAAPLNDAGQDRRGGAQRLG